MTASIEKVVIIEIGGSHDECLYTQLIALEKNGVQVTLIVNEEISHRNQHFEEFCSEIIVIDSRRLKDHKRATIKSIWKKIKRINPTKVVLNTAQGKEIKTLCFLAIFSKIEFVGVLHTTRKLEGSFTQKLISLKIKKYLFLSEFLMEKVKSKSKAKLGCFYPIDFYKTSINNEELINKQITIIGGVETRRKDLQGFIWLASQLKDQNLKYVFLGKSDPKSEVMHEFIFDLQRNGLLDKVQFYDSFVSHQLFNEQLQKSMFILPLVHPETPSSEQYFNNQISGAMTVSFGYSTPMLIHEAYQNIEEMNDASFYYNFDNFAEMVEQAMAELDLKRSTMKTSYNAVLEQNKYANFVLNLA